MNKLMARLPHGLLRPTVALALGLYVAGAATAVHAASFPNYPLQTGSGLVPPNIMFILDNSGSMADSNMKRVDAPGIRLGAKALTVNSLSYDPTVTYTAWAKVDANGQATNGSGQPIVEAGGTTYTAAYSDTSNATSPINIGDSLESVFYLLRTGQVGNSSAHYDRYRIDSLGNVKKASVISANDNSQADLSFPWTSQGNYSDPQLISVGADKAMVRLTISGSSGSPRIYATNGGTAVCQNSTSCDFHILGPTVLSVRVYAGGNANAGASTVSTSFVQLGPETTAVPGSRTNSAEATNIATWYSFHRTRMKAAKAGASAAFIGLGSGYRVGFDTLNRNGNTNTVIQSPIPVDSNSGLFEGGNKKTWYDLLLSQTANGYTPLRSALKRTGDYYSTAAPWTDGTGTSEQSCRASYAMLTTDGFWNQDDNFSIGGDIDGDGWSNTLADVAAYYWQTDLRPALDNNVPTNVKDPANWQHMSMFSVSIGQQGKLPITTPPPSSWPDPTDAEDAERIDDLWHAAVNAKGPNLIVASRSDDFKTALLGALSLVKEQRASGSNITANGNSLNNGAQIFQAVYSMPSWTGDVLAYGITRGGIASSPQWSLADKANADAAGFVARPVYTWKAGTGGVPFNTTNNPGIVGRVGGNAAVSIADNIAYIKGERSLEIKNGGTLRDRVSPIGDIVNSSPFYERQLTSLFIGANDGMLHGIDSDTGKVLFSYMPNGIDWAKLSDLSDPTYSEGSAKHIFAVDGQMDVSDTAQGGGKNILVSGLGRGGRGVFALDVTSMNTHDVDGAFTGSFGASNVLFDTTGSLASDAQMGYVLAQPQIRLLNNTTGYTPAIITGNGISQDETTTRESVLYIYDTNGNVRKKIPTGKTGPNNGLSQTSVADLDSDGYVDTIYAGDMMGNVFKFDVSDKNDNKWKVSLLFSAKDAGGAAQPITGGITAARHPATGQIFLVFGTGKLIGTSDLVSSAAQPTQTIYGLIDSNSTIAGRASLQVRTFPYSGTDSQGRLARGLENYSSLPTGKQGWYVDLANNASTWARGERVVTSPTLNGRAAWISSVIPLLGAGCNNAGRGYLNVIDIFTGTNPADGSYFDVNGNGKGDDKVGDGYVSSVDLGVAMPGAPAIVDTKVVVNGSNAQVASEDVISGDPSSYRVMWRELVNRN